MLKMTALGRLVICDPLVISFTCTIQSPCHLNSHSLADNQPCLSQSTRQQISQKQNQRSERPQQMVVMSPSCQNIT